MIKKEDIMDIKCVNNINGQFANLYIYFKDGDKMFCRGLTISYEDILDICNRRSA